MSATSSPGASPEVQRVSTIELFFDLIFVFTLTQLTNLIAHPHAPTDYLKTILVFMTLMWIYDGFAWLTSNIALATTRQRQLVFLAMAGFFVMALSIPQVSAQGGLPYALGLLVVTCVHAGLFTTVPGGSARAILRIVLFNFASVLFGARRRLRGPALGLALLDRGGGCSASRRISSAGERFRPQPLPFRGASRAADNRGAGREHSSRRGRGEGSNHG